MSIINAIYMIVCAISFFLALIGTKPNQHFARYNLLGMQCEHRTHYPARYGIHALLLFQTDTHAGHCLRHQAKRISPDQYSAVAFDER